MERPIKEESRGTAFHSYWAMRRFEGSNQVREQEDVFITIVILAMLGYTGGQANHSVTEKTENISSVV